MTDYHLERAHRDSEHAKLLMREALRDPDGPPLPNRSPLAPLTEQQFHALNERRRARASRINRRQLRRLRALSTRCYICRQILGQDFQVDHIIPLSRGGTHTEENLALTHPRCNNRKAALFVSIDVKTRLPRLHA